jgi:hypothetical protein
MSTKPLMLEGFARESPSSAELQQLRREKQRIEEELLSVRRQLEDVTREKESIARSLHVLRQQLSPLHRALRAVFGEIELAIGEEQSSSTSTQSFPAAAGPEGARWESYKNTFPGVPARIIDALLAHREMNVAQLATLLKAAYSTTKDAVAKLRQSGAVVKEGGKGGMVRLNR